MTDPLVSVLIPAYRAQATIRRCLDSFLSGPNAGIPIELLVESDDGSGYAEIAALPGVRVAVTGAVASGVGAARNRALARARAAFVTYVDADDRVAPDYLLQLLATARGGAAVARTRVVLDGQPLARFGTAGEDLTFATLSRHGASFRGLFPRDLCPGFDNDLSQDILHMTEVLLRHGPIPIAATDYTLHLAPGSVTAADDFSTRVDAAYLRHIDRLAARHPDHPELGRAQAVFHAKRELNRRYGAEGRPGESYYAFIARVLD